MEYLIMTGGGVIVGTFVGPLIILAMGDDIMPQTRAWLAMQLVIGVGLVVIGLNC